jgi:hypothetical protein
MYIPSLRSSGIPGLPSFISRSGFGYRQTKPTTFQSVGFTPERGNRLAGIGSTYGSRHGVIAAAVLQGL